MIYKSALLNIIGSIISNLIIIFAYIFVSRTLGPTLMGQYSYELWMISIGVLLSNGGINIALSKYIPELKRTLNKNQINYLSTRLFILTLTISLLCSLFVLFIFPLFKDTKSYYNYLIVIAICIPIVSLSGTLLAYFQGHEKFKFIASFNIFNSFIYGGSIILSAIIFKSVFAVLIAYFIGYAINLGFLLLFGKFQEFKEGNEKINKSQINEILHYIITVFFIIIIDTIIWDKSEVFFLKRYTQDQQVAFYTISYTFVTKISSIIPAALSNVLIPAYSSLLHVDEKLKRDKIYYKSTKYLALFILPIAFGGTALSTPIIKYVLGNQYHGEIGTLRVMFVFCIFGVISSSSSALLYSIKKQTYILYVGLILSIASILLDFFIIPRFASIGAAFTNGIIQTIGICCGWFYIIKTLDVKFPFVDILKAGVAAGVMSICVFFFTLKFDNIFSLLLIIIFAAVLYIGLLLAFKTLDSEDYTLLTDLLLYTSKAGGNKVNLKIASIITYLQGNKED